jgi:very-short-patch-repair endonuclease
LRREAVRQGVLRAYETRPEIKERLRTARLRQVLPKEMTKIERLLLAEFRKRRLTFEMYPTMFGQFKPDFVFRDAMLIVQADGDYWHSLPKNVRLDFEFNACAVSEGWTVWRFAGSKILAEADTCARAVARFVRSHRCQLPNGSAQSISGLLSQ